MLYQPINILLLWTGSAQTPHDFNLNVAASLWTTLYLLNVHDTDSMDRLSFALIMFKARTPLQV